jgi:hypothetical protein
MRWLAERRRIMIDLQVPGAGYAEAGFAYVRHRSVLHLFRLSNRVLLLLISLDHAPLVRRITVRAALWASGMLAKTASALLFGQWHNPRKADFGEDDETTGV